jgi:hypothetical protein
MKTKQSRTLKLDWELLRNALLILTTLGSLIGLYKWWFPDRPTFGVQVQLEPVAIPEPFYEQLRELVNAVDIMKIDRDIREKVEKLPVVDPYRYRTLRRHISLSITNTGNRPAKQVELQIGRKGVARIKMKDQTTKEIEFTDRIPLNDLAIRETAKLEWWDDGSQPYSGNDSVEICHDAGNQNVSLPRQYSGVTDAFFSQTGFFGVILITLVATLVLAFVQALLSVAVNRSKQERSETITPANQQAQQDTQPAERPAVTSEPRS